MNGDVDRRVSDNVISETSFLHGKKRLVVGDGTAIHEEGASLQGKLVQDHAWTAGLFWSTIARSQLALVTDHLHVLIHN